MSKLKYRSYIYALWTYNVMYRVVGMCMGNKDKEHFRTRSVNNANETPLDLFIFFHFFVTSLHLRLSETQRTQLFSFSRYRQENFLLGIEIEMLEIGSGGVMLESRSLS